jgi:hypothetical protein
VGAGNRTQLSFGVTKKLLALALASAFAVCAQGCGRHDDQSKAADTGSTANSAPANSTAEGPSKAPLQTGETDPSKAAQLPSGTQSGARSTPNPK